MDITFSSIREREVINIFDGKRLGRVLDILFDDQAGYVLGFVLPGIKKKFLRKSEDIFVPLSNVVKLGDDVVLVKLEPNSENKTILDTHNGLYNYYVYPDKNEK